MHKQFECRTQYERNLNTTGAHISAALRPFTFASCIIIMMIITAALPSNITWLNLIALPPNFDALFFYFRFPLFYLQSNNVVWWDNHIYHRGYSWFYGIQIKIDRHDIDIFNNQRESSDSYSTNTISNRLIYLGKKSTSNSQCVIYRLECTMMIVVKNMQTTFTLIINI